MMWELKQRYNGYRVEEYNVIIDVLGGYSKHLEKLVRKLPDEIYICDKFCFTYWRLRDSCIVVCKLFNDLLVGSLLLLTLIDFFQQYKAMQI